MARSIDVRKIETPANSYYESVEDRVAYTFVGRLKGITEAGQTMLGRSKDFCRLLRTLVKKLQAGETVSKPKLGKSFKLPSRVIQAAIVAAETVIKSTTATQQAALDDTEDAINRQAVSLYTCPSGKLHGRIKKLMRLYRKQKNLLAQKGRPHIHFGGKHYQDQEAKGWKKAYETARNDRIGCIGCAAEKGGNGTLQIKSVNPEAGKLSFNLYSSKKLLGHFNLGPKERAQLEAILAINNQPFKEVEVICTTGKNKGKPTKREVTTGRVPLTIWLIKHENKHWYIHISFLKDKAEPEYAPVGATGVDLNCDSIADTQVQIADGEPLVVKHNKRYFDPSWGKAKKEQWIYEQVNEIVLEAKANHSLISLEYLEFEGPKRWLKNKLGKMLRVMPYRKIRKVFERRCMEHGVVLRYVRSQYTSILGAVLTSYPNLGRDQAAAAIIGLRALEDGNTWLEQHCRELAAKEQCRLRINRKSKFGCTVTTDGVLIDRQSEAMPLEDRKTGPHLFQNRIAREISDLSKAMGTHLSVAGWLPLCWKRTDSDWSPRHTVVPGVKRSSEKPLAQLELVVQTAACTARACRGSGPTTRQRPLAYSRRRS